jgi:uncharacterized protein YecE (DUF72 family)
MASASGPRAKATRKGALRIGTSGWHYKSWWGPFFPGGLKKKDALKHYASIFDCTELNAPFYRTPTIEAVQGWAEQTPPDFRFAWKASRFITHWKRLSERSDTSLALMETRLAHLGGKLGPVLFQLPPAMKADRERLASFLALLEPGRLYAFEFRHPSWYDATIFQLLRDHDHALCISDHADAPSPFETTASWAYVRGHGSGGRYEGSYSDATLAQWAKSIAAWRRGGKDVWCFFDNDIKSAAPFDAQRLSTLCGVTSPSAREPSRPPSPPPAARAKGRTPR